MVECFEGRINCFTLFGIFFGNSLHALGPQNFTDCLLTVNVQETGIFCELLLVTTFLFLEEKKK